MVFEPEHIQVDSVGFGLMWCAPLRKLASTHGHSCSISVPMCTVQARMLEAKLFADNDGRVHVSLQQPVTSHRSLDCFIKALQHPSKLTVVTSPLEVATLCDATTADWVCSASRPMRVCDLDPSNIPRKQYPAYSGQTRQSKVAKTFDSSDVATGSSSGVGVDAVMGDGDNSDLLDELVNDAADIHDDGLSLGHRTEDSETIGPEDNEAEEVVQESGDNALRSARAKGLLPENVEVPVFGGASCYTPEELELNAVQTSLSRQAHVSCWGILSHDMDCFIVSFLWCWSS